MRVRETFVVFYFSLILLLASLLVPDVFAHMQIPEDNLGYPVLVALKGNVIGSGFYLDGNKFFYFVTAKHVLFKKTSKSKKDCVLVAKTIELTGYRPEIDEISKNEFIVDLEHLFQMGAVIYHHISDIAIIVFGKHVRIGDGPGLIYNAGINKKGGIAHKVPISVNAYSVKKFRSVLVGNDVFLFGYPASLSIPKRPQFDKRKPLLRKGIVAGKNLKEQTIIIDCPGYPGNSGGLVIEIEEFGYANTYQPIGVLTQYIPYMLTFIDPRTGKLRQIPTNSGYSVVEPMDKILELLPE